MSVVDYYRASHQDKIKLRVAFLTALKIYQAMREDEARLARKRKLNEVVGSNSSSSSGSGESSSNSSTEMIEALQLLPPAMTEVVNILKRDTERHNKVLRGENKVLRGEMSELKGENKMLRSEIATLKRKVETLKGIRPVLNGPLAYDKITAFELWREVFMYL